MRYCFRSSISDSVIRIRGRFRRTSRDILIESIAAYRVASAHLRTRGLACVLRLMGYALKLGGAPRRLSRNTMVWFRSQRDPQRATSTAPTVSNLTRQGIPCAPWRPEEKLLSGYDGLPLWLVNICGLVLTDCSTKSDMEFGKVSVRGAPKNLEMLWLPARLAHHLVSFASNRRDRVARILTFTTFVMAVLFFAFDVDRLPRTLLDLGNLDLGRFELAFERYLVAPPQPDAPYGVGSNVREKLAIATFNDKSVSKHGGHFP